MKKINFILLSCMLYFCSCQENFKDVPNQIIQEGKARLWMIKNLDGTLHTKTVSIKDKQWSKGDTIKIKFLTGGSYSVDYVNKVKQYAAIWLEYATSLHFEYVTEKEEADVKIGFEMDNRWLTWSTIGKDCQNIPQNEPSINFYWEECIDDNDIQGDVLRGFGHILGLVFEHQSPNTPIEFNTKARKLLASNYGLSEEDIDQLMYLYNSDQTNYSQYDPNSIMVLSIYPNMLIDKSYATDFNTELSSQDIMWAEKLYKDTREGNIDSLANININTINEQITIHGIRCYLGINLDGGEPLPFIMTNCVDSTWVGYISQGTIHKKLDTTKLAFVPYQGNLSVCIFQNELYVTYQTPHDMTLFVYSLNNFEITFTLEEETISPNFYCLPYVLNGKKYIASSNTRYYDTIYIYNRSEKKKIFLETKIQLPQKHYLNIAFVKSNYIYFTVVNTETQQTILYKQNLDGTQLPSIIGIINKPIYGYNLSGCINDHYYIGGRYSGKLLILNPNDEIQIKSIDTDIDVINYLGKLYQGKLYGMSAYSPLLIRE